MTLVDTAAVVGLPLWSFTSHIAFDIDWLVVVICKSVRQGLMRSPSEDGSQCVHLMPFTLVHIRFDVLQLSSVLTEKIKVLTPCARTMMFLIREHHSRTSWFDT